MKQREELARVIEDATETYVHEEPGPFNAADAILAAGYRKPRIITAIEQLDALPTGSVILDAARFPYQKSHISGWTGCDSSTVYTYGDLLELPATVLYEPGERDV